MPFSALKVLSSMATREVLVDMIARYREVTGRSVTAAAAGGVEVAQRVNAGEDVDVVVLASHAIDALMTGGRLLPGSRVNIVRSGIAVAVRAGTRLPIIDTEEQLKSAVLAAKSLGYSTGPSGVYLEKMFERWGILDTVRGRIVVPPPGVPVGSLIASDAVALGFQQLSELLNVENVEVVGPLPPAVQNMTVFSAGLSTRCGDPEAARGLQSFMASPEVVDIKRRYGMEAA